MNWFRTENACLSANDLAVSCLCCLAALAISHDAVAGTLVVVPPGLEEVEGNTIRYRGAHPDETLIFQELYPASDFLGVPSGQNAIVAMRLRPDMTVTSPRVIPFEMYELRLSTTDAVPSFPIGNPDGLDRYFDQNRGDDEIVVFRGPLQWETDGAGPIDGPRNFDYVVEFQTPFPYHPSCGRSLLVEEQVFMLGPDEAVAPNVDAEDFPGQGIRRIGAMPHTEPMAEAAWDDALVRQFEFVSSADFDEDGDVDSDDFLTWQTSFGVDDGGDADFDGDTDGDDFLVWQSRFGSGSASTVVPEPVSIVLLIPAVVGGIFVRRWHSKG